MEQSSRLYTALVAEDDADFRETLELWLASDGWEEIREAEDGRETLEKLDESVDVLVLDRRMPALSGPEVVERLDETPFDGPVVVVSAFRPDEHLNENHVTSYMTKPFKRDRFVTRLREIVRKADTM